MKENLITKTTVWAMEIVSRYVKEGDVVVDATMGNGHDTLALATLTGPSGKVLAFDIQPQAVTNTRELLFRHGIQEPRVQLILDTNGNMKQYLQPFWGNVAAVLFNLGYLPGGDKEITTEGTETLAAVQTAVALIQPGGLVIAVLYSGHPQGAEEKELLLSWAKDISSKEYHVAYISMWNQKKNPPEILLITKK